MPDRATNNERTQNNNKKVTTTKIRREKNRIRNGKCVCIDECVTQIMYFLFSFSFLFFILCSKCLLLVSFHLPAYRTPHHFELLILLVVLSFISIRVADFFSSFLRNDNRPVYIQHYYIVFLFVFVYFPSAIHFYTLHRWSVLRMRLSWNYRK